MFEKELQELHKTAAELGISCETVTQAQCTAQKEFSKQKFSNSFVGPESPRSISVLPRVKDLQKVLSPKEFKIFVLKKMGQKTEQSIARMLGVKRGTVYNLVQRIKTKLDDQYKKLLDPKVQIEGLETFFSRPSSAGCEEKRPNCRNCFYYYGSVITNQGRQVVCSKHSFTTFINDKECWCKHYREYISNKLQDRELLKEKLKDKWFLKTAYNKEVNGYEPTDPIEKSQYAIAGIAFKNYHMRKKRLRRMVIEKAARYAVVPLDPEERQREEVKQAIKYLNILPVMSDFDKDEEGNTYSIAYYVLEDARQFRILMWALIGQADFTIPEKGTIAICFSRKVLLKTIYVKRKGSDKKEKLELDYNDNIPRYEHTAKFNCNPGKYIITIMLGRKPGNSKTNSRWNAVFEYELDIAENSNGSCYISSSKPL